MSLTQKTLAIAIGSIFSCSTTFATPVNDNVTTQDQFQNLLQQNQSIEFDDQHHIEIQQAIWEVSTQAQDVMISGHAPSLIHLSGNKQQQASLTINALKNLTIRSDSSNENHEGLIHLASANTELTFKGKENEFFNSLTLASENGPAISATPTTELVENPDSSVDGHDNPLTKANIGIYAMHSNISTQNGTAIFLDGAGTADGTRSDLEFKRIDDESLAQKQTLSIRSPDKAVVAKNGGGFTADIHTVNIHGAIEIEDAGWVSLGLYNVNDLPQDWQIDGFDDAADSTILDTVSIVSDKDETIELEDAGFIIIAAKNVTIENTSNNGKAIEIEFDNPDDADDDPQAGDQLVADIYAEDNLRIKGDIVINGDGLRDNGKQGYVRIFTAEQGKVHIDGNVTVNCDEQSSAVVRIQLTPGSILNGAVNLSTHQDSHHIQTLATNALAPSEANLDLDHAIWNVTGPSNLSNIKSAAGTINIAKGATLTLQNMANQTGGTNIYVNEVKENIITLNSNKNEGLRIHLNDSSELDGKTTEQKIEALKAIQNIKDSSHGIQISAEESTVSGGLSIDLDKNGDVFNVTTNVNSVTASLNDVASHQLLLWRSQTDNVNKRLGDLRSYSDLHGAWVRVFGSKDKFKDQNLENEQTTVQIGADTRFNTHYYVGLSTSYTDGESTLLNGSSDDKAISFGLYGGWLSDNGHFIDIIMNRYRMDSAFDLHYHNGDQTGGDFHTWGTSLSAQYGYRFQTPNNQIWVEPQVEMTYGHVDSVDYVTSAGVRVSQDSMDSFITRLGCAVGMNLAQGSVFTKLSLAHDRDGKTMIRMNDGLEHTSTPQDLSGTWGEFTLGGTWNINNSLSAYGELQTSFGTPVESPYQWNVGMRYHF